jgi:hypothetical protein
MTEQGKSSQNQENSSQEKLVHLKVGLNAVYMPDLGIRDPYDPDETVPAPPEETLQELQSFLDEIDRQGGELLAVVPVEVDKGHRSGYINNVTEERQIFIIRRGE